MYILSSAINRYNCCIDELSQAILTANTARVSQIILELQALQYSTGGAVALGEGWLALERGNLAAAQAYCERAIHTGLPILALAAINRLVLAACAQRQGQTVSAAQHMLQALANAESPVTSAVILGYAQALGITLPSTEELGKA